MSAQMLDAAPTFAVANEAILDLTDAFRREVPFVPVTNVVGTNSSVGSDETKTRPLPFFGASLAQVAMPGSANSNLNLNISDENGSLICQDVGPSDTTCYSFVPARNGMFQITVTNTGPATNSYVIAPN